MTEVCGTDNLAGGLKSGIEGGVHAMRELWADDDTEVVVLVDASNAFNSLDRQTALWNCRILWSIGLLISSSTLTGATRAFL